MKKSELIEALRDVPEDAEVLVAPGLGDGDTQYPEWALHGVRYFDAYAAYLPGVTDWDVRFPSVSSYDPDYNAVWLKL